MKITINHNQTTADITSKVGPLKIQPMNVTGRDEVEVVRKALEIVRTQFLKPGKNLTIQILSK